MEGADNADLDDLRDRVVQQIDAEASGDVDCLYELIDPEIRARREAERTDEPELSLSSIRGFVAKLTAARLLSVEITELHDRVALHGNRTVAKVLTQVEYRVGERTLPSSFRTLWVRDLDCWYTTALGKFV